MHLQPDGIEGNALQLRARTDLILDEASNWQTDRNLISNFRLVIINNNNNSLSAFSFSALADLYDMKLGTFAQSK